MKKIIFGFFILAACFSFLASRLYAETQQHSQGEYLISANDLLQINVYHEPDLSQTYRVNLNGNIMFPLLGEINVAGISAGDLQENLTKLLGKDYLVNPQVSVLILEYAKFSITGQVRNAGVYQLKDGLTVADAILFMGGGFVESAFSTDIKLFRMKEGKRQAMEINTAEMLEDSSNRKKNPFLQAGDVIVVGSAAGTIVSDYFVVLGQVRNPGKFTLTKNMNIVEAIALAGGLTINAAPNSTKLIRIENGKKKAIHIPLGSILAGRDLGRDITIQPNDTIIVPESLF